MRKVLESLISKSEVIFEHIFWHKDDLHLPPIVYSPLERCHSLGRLLLSRISGKHRANLGAHHLFPVPDNLDQLNVAVLDQFFLHVVKDVVELLLAHQLGPLKQVAYLDVAGYILVSCTDI